jgi:hypothetical protein
VQRSISRMPYAPSGSNRKKPTNQPTDLESQVPVFMSPGNRVAYLYAQALGSFSAASYDSQHRKHRFHIVVDVCYHSVAKQRVSARTHRKHLFCCQKACLLARCQHCADHIGKTSPVFLPRVCCPRCLAVGLCFTLPLIRSHWKI